MFDTESRPTLKLEALPCGSAMAMFQTMFASSFEATLLTRPRGEILAANAEACAVFGASEAALLERSRVDAHLSLADASDPRLAALVAERAAHGRARGGVRLLRLDGSHFEAEVSSFLFLDEAGLATSVLTVRDLTPVRLAERDARDSAQRLSFALDAADIGEWDMNLDTNITRRSLRHDQCFGYQSPPASWDYDTFLAHIHPADREIADTCHQAGMSAGGDHDVEFRVIWPDGSLHWLWSKGRVHCDDDGRPVRVAGIVLDVTARRVAADALQRSEERLQLALRASSDGMWDFDLRTQEPHYSPRWLQMVGLPETPSPLDGTLWLRLCHPDDVERVHDTFHCALAGHEDTFEIEFRLMHRDGHAVPVLSRGFVLRAADGTALRVSGINTDLTIRNQLMEAQNARLAAEAANRAKSEFLSRMSHELRTPLNAVLGFSQLLTTNPSEPLSARQLRQVKHIEQGGWHLLNMVDEVLDLSRIDSGHARVKEEVVEVPTLLRECAGLLEASAAARSIQLDCSPDPAALALAGDRTRVKQILLNLLGNAIKYTQAGGRVTLASLWVDRERVELSVTDNGPGLSAAQQAQLFQPFNRLGQEDGPTPGTGIGLVISQRLAELMRGSLSVQSAPGLGCAFAVTLPAQPRQAGVQLAALFDQSMANLDALQQRGRVLYIEDNAANAEVMQGFVAKRPLVDLEVQRTAQDGMAAAVRRQPNLILLDLQLPDLPGLDVLRQLRQHPMTAAVPVVVISASAMADSVAAATEAGAVDYLAKPLRLETLLATLDRCLPEARLP
jgi:PAS domain S-box-containing protein